LIPVDERPVPQNLSLATSPTQPFPRGGDSILPPCDSWKDKIPPGFVPGCMFDPPQHDVPNRLGQWASVRIAPMSYSPQTGYFYAQGASSLLWRSGAGDDPYLGEVGSHGVDQRIPNYPTPTNVVAAVDQHTGKVVWRKELPDFEGSGYKGAGGALSTAGGLVFHQGGDGTLQAYDARTGETLWKFQTDFPTGDAPPMSYSIGGKQYVAFIAGTRVWAFTLGGTLLQSTPKTSPPRDEITGPIEDTNEIETTSLEQAPANGHRYRINEYAFNPYRARVRAGTPLTFINNGYTPHTMVAADGSWTTGTLTPTQIATLTVDKPGHYLYFTKEYPWSYGELIVTPASVPNTSTPATSQSDVSSADQPAVGKTAYTASCAVCHGESLAGRDPAPALVGRGFLARWNGRDALALFDRIRTTMPPTAPGTLSEERYAAIVSYLLNANDQPAPRILDRQSMKSLTITVPQSLTTPAPHW
jgi:outer membrane protein assembly factor BamB/cytochrome c5